MDNLLHITAVYLIILWAIALFALKMGPVIHIMLALAVITLLLQAIREIREYN